MEGLTNGWKKSINNYHFFDVGSLSSVCCNANYSNSDFKKQEFLTEAELDTSMKICKRCWNLRVGEAIQQIKDARVKGNWQITKCPKCKTDVMYWNGKKDKQEHLCTVCSKMVIV